MMDSTLYNGPFRMFIFKMQFFTLIDELTTVSLSKVSEKIIHHTLTYTSPICIRKILFQFQDLDALLYAIIIYFNLRCREKSDNT